MKKMFLDIAGLKYHDFKDQLEVFFETAIGKTVMLMLEEENVGETNAVAAYVGSKCLGYVTSKMRRLALGALRDCGEEELMATVVEIDRERRHLYVEVEVSDTSMPDMTDEPNVLTNWNYEGPKLIRMSAEASRLKASILQLTRLLKASPEDWTSEMEELLQGIEELLAYDISGEIDASLVKLDEMLTALGERNRTFRVALLRLQFSDREMNADTGREKLAQLVRDLAVSKEMNKLLERLGDEALVVVKQLPKALVSELHTDLALLMGHLRYWRQPRMKVQNARCLLALQLRLEQDGRIVKKRRKKSLVSPELVKLAQTTGKDELTTAVRQLAAEEALRETNPELFEQLQEATSHKGATATPNVTARRQLALECMEAHIREELEKPNRMWKNVLAPYVAAIRIGMVPNTMTVVAFNAKYNANVSPSTFAKNVPKEIANSAIPEADTESFEKEYSDLLNP